MIGQTFAFNDDVRSVAGDTGGAVDFFIDSRNIGIGGCRCGADGCLFFGTSKKNDKEQQIDEANIHSIILMGQ